MILLDAEAAGLPVFFCDPEMVEIVPEGSYVLAGGPDPVSMAIALENLPAKDIVKMSKKMIRARKSVSQDVQIKKLLEVYELAVHN